MTRWLLPDAASTSYSQGCGETPGYRYGYGYSSLMVVGNGTGYGYVHNTGWIYRLWSNRGVIFPDVS